MRILSISADPSAEDLVAARTVIDQEIAAQLKNVLVMFGDDRATADLADRVGIRSDVFPWREAIWLKTAAANAPDIIGPARFADWFPGAPDACAVVLDFTDQPVRRLDTSATLAAIELAFLAAQQGGDA